MTIPITPDAVRKALLRKLQASAENFTRDAGQKHEFEKSVDAVHDFAEFNSVKLDTLATLFDDEGVPRG